MKKSKLFLLALLVVSFTSCGAKVASTSNPTSFTSSDTSSSTPSSGTSIITSEVSSTSVTTTSVSTIDLPLPTDVPYYEVSFAGLENFGNDEKIDDALVEGLDQNKDFYTMLLNQPDMKHEHGHVPFGCLHKLWGFRRSLILMLWGVLSLSNTPMSKQDAVVPGP